MAFPTPRDPLCNITHTVWVSSKHTSMKWLPVPSVPKWFKLLVFFRNGCFSHNPLKPALNASHLSQRPLVVHPSLRCRVCRGCHAPMRNNFSILLRIASNESGKSLAFKVVFAAAIIPQPKSTPPPGITAPMVRNHAKWLRLSQMHIRHRRHPLVNKWHLRNVQQFAFGVVVERHAFFVQI